MANQRNSGTYVAFDVGNARIGVAIASAEARLARPAGYIKNDDQVWDRVEDVVSRNAAQSLIVGLPRNLQGDDTPQTAVARRFASDLEQRTHLPVALQDEALTSRRAEEELTQRGKPFGKGDIDALAATYILDDYLANEGK